MIYNGFQYVDPRHEVDYELQKVQEIINRNGCTCRTASDCFPAGEIAKADWYKFTGRTVVEPTSTMQQLDAAGLNYIMTEGTQTISGTKTFTNDLYLYK
jgi:hypothetical protein